MRLIPFEDRFKNHIALWLSMRGMPTFLVDELPQIGMIALDEETPIAAGFLRKLEPNYGILDSFITRPSSGLARNQTIAIDAIIDALIQIAKSIELKAVFYNTQSKEMIRRKLKYQFRDVPGMMMARDLREAI